VDVFADLAARGRLDELAAGDPSPEISSAHRAIRRRRTPTFGMRVVG
jgi:hypothetical protein